MINLSVPNTIPNKWLRITPWLNNSKSFLVNVHCLIILCDLYKVIITQFDFFITFFWKYVFNIDHINSLLSWLIFSHNTALFPWKLNISLKISFSKIIIICKISHPLMIQNFRNWNPFLWIFDKHFSYEILGILAYWMREAEFSFIY